jgi:hypothetical protein
MALFISMTFALGVLKAVPEFGLSPFNFILFLIGSMAGILVLPELLPSLTRQLYATYWSNPFDGALACLADSEAGLAVPPWFA